MRLDGPELVPLFLVDLGHGGLHETRVKAHDSDAARLHVEGEDLAHHVLGALAHVVPFEPG